MAALDYNELVLVAQELIADTGRAITLQKLSATAADVNKPWNGPATPTVSTSVNTVGTFVPHQGSDLGKTLVSEELLARCEQVLLVAPTQSDISEMNFVVDTSIKWKIDWVQVLKPGATIVLYVFGVSR